MKIKSQYRESANQETEKPGKKNDCTSKRIADNGPRQRNASPPIKRDPL